MKKFSKKNKNKIKMKRVFGAKKDKEPPPSIQDASDRVRNLICSINIYAIFD